MSILSTIVKYLYKIFLYFYSFFVSDRLYFKKSNTEVVNEKIKLGEGGFGDVYLSHDCYNKNKKYALKRLLIQTIEDENMVLREINSFEKFKHRNILEMIDFVYRSESSGKREVYLLMTFAEKGSLRNELDKILEGSIQKPSLVFVLKQFFQICEAFNVLHSHRPSFIHQDIKPDNILITSQGEPKLTDFGSAREAELFISDRNKSLQVSEDAAKFCTAPYRAPELFDPPKGETIDTRTDIWGIGCLLFAWWHGYSPFECQFLPDDSIKIVETSLLRVLSDIPQKSHPSEDDLTIESTVKWILIRNYKTRPFISDLLIQIDEMLGKLEGRSPKYLPF